MSIALVRRRLKDFTGLFVQVQLSSNDRPLAHLKNNLFKPPGNSRMVCTVRTITINQ